jgi:protoporphyrinogen oxidase
LARSFLELFFKSYSEKVWGVPCEEISADWAAQRINKLSITSLIANALVPQWLRRDKNNGAKSLIDSFYYPRLGPGQLWERVAELVRESGNSVILDRQVESISKVKDGSFEVISSSKDGQRFTNSADHLLSSMALPHLVRCLKPAPPERILEAAKGLRHRAMLIVVLIVEGRDFFPDNWLYIHSPNMRVGRIQNFNNWSPALSPDHSKTALAFEYFCSTTDEFWSYEDDQLRDIATKELRELNLCGTARIVDACVLRIPQAYPVYTLDYKERTSLILEYLAANMPGLQAVGRNGMHRYNNQDHATMAGFLAARNVLAGEKLYDLGRINQDAIYLEGG